MGHSIFNPDHPVLKAAGCTNWGQWCVREGKGIFNPDHPKLKALGITNFGQWCHLMAKGIFDPDHPELKALGITNWGEWSCHLMAKGLFDPANAQVVHDGRVKGVENAGVNARDNKLGIFDPANAQAVHDGQVKGGKNNVLLKKASLILPMLKRYMMDRSKVARTVTYWGKASLILPMLKRYMMDWSKVVTAHVTRRLAELELGGADSICYRSILKR